MWLEITEAVNTSGYIYNLHKKIPFQSNKEEFETNTWLLLSYNLFRTLECIIGASLVAQWLRIGLPVQGTRVRALVWEDPTCRGATKPVSHNYWAWALEPTNHNYWAHVPRARAPQQEKPPQWEAHAPQQRVAPCSLQLEKAHAQQQRPNTAKNK